MKVPIRPHYGSSNFVEVLFLSLSNGKAFVRKLTLLQARGKSCEFMGAPLPPNEAERLRTLRSYNILDTPPEVAFERITSLAARLFDVPISLVSLIDADRQWFKACFGMDIYQTDRKLSFCAYAILSDEVMIVPDATLDPRFSTTSRLWESLIFVPMRALRSGPPVVRIWALSV